MTDNQHHPWCNRFIEPRAGCPMCAGLFERYPTEGIPDLMAHYFPNNVRIYRHGSPGVAEFMSTADQALPAPDGSAGAASLGRALARAEAERDALRALAQAYDDARWAIADHVEECPDCDELNLLCAVIVPQDVIKSAAIRELVRLAKGLTDVDSAMAALKRAALAGRTEGGQP